jgi:hypothetical protein
MARPSEKEETDFTAALGAAVAQWGGVEAQMYLLYITLCTSGTFQAFPNSYSVIYETIISLEAKLSIIDALAQFKIKDAEFLEGWSRLHNKIKRKIRRVRNKLAHWQVWRSSKESHLPIFLGQHLYGPSENVPDFGTAHGGAMGAAQLIEHAHNFTDLATEIGEFRARVRTLFQTTPELQPAPTIPPLPQREEGPTPTKPSGQPRSSGQ